MTPMVALVLPNYLFPTPSTYPYGAPQMLAEGPLTPASRSPSPSLPPLPPSPPHRPNSPLFNSRCSSPLQLNLLQLEEPPRGEGGAAAGGSGSSAGPPPPSEETAEPEARLVSSDPVPPAPILLGPPHSSHHLVLPSHASSYPPGCPQRMGSWGGRPQLSFSTRQKSAASSVKWGQSCLTGGKDIPINF